MILYYLLTIIYAIFRLIKEALSAVNTSLSKLTPTYMQTFNARLKKAQASRLPLSESHLSERLINLVTAHADAVGVPQVLWPLLK